MRVFKGSIGVGRTNLDTQADYDEDANAITLTITNRSGDTVSVTITNTYSGDRTSQLLRAGKSLELQWDVAPAFGWYEFVITVDHDAVFEQRLAGHVENGQNSISDPLMGGLV